MKKSFLLFSMGLFVFTASLAQAQTLTWTAGGVGGGWYSIAGGISNLINEKSGGITVKVIPGGWHRKPEPCQ